MCEPATDKKSVWYHMLILYLYFISTRNIKNKFIILYNRMAGLDVCHKIRHFPNLHLWYGYMAINCHSLLFQITSFLYNCSVVTPCKTFMFLSTWAKIRKLRRGTKIRHRHILPWRFFTMIVLCHTLSEGLLVQHPW